MIAGYKIRYANDWKGHTFKTLKVINNETLNKVELIWWFEDDDYKHYDIIGQWRQKQNKI